jgi:hypothetical protein
MLPLSPDVAEPELKTKVPLAPADPEAAVAIVSAPLEVAVLPPVLISTSPPVLADV